MEAKKPYVLAVIIQLIYTGMFVVSKAAFDKGMNTFVFIFYRMVAASLLLLPIAIFLESNSMPVVAFCLALLLRMEVVKLRSISGMAKLAGVALCLAGVFVLAFYTGPALSPVNPHRAFAVAHASNKIPSRMTWIKGTFFMVLANVTWALWIVLQKAYAIAIAIQLVYTGMFVVSKAAFDHGINTYVFMFYRQAAGSLLLLPLALLRNR
nr:unnamed protein product [Digitaria exilis]